VTGDRLADLARHRAELPQCVVLQDQRYAKVTRIVLSGSRPSSGRKVRICMAAPSSATIKADSTSAIQKLPVAVKTSTPT